jgi:hypothetical protein
MLSYKGRNERRKALPHPFYVLCHILYCDPEVHCSWTQMTPLFFKTYEHKEESHETRLMNLFIYTEEELTVKLLV